MSKKNKKSSSQNNQQRQHSQVETPYIVDIDALAYASDDDLRERQSYLLSTKDVAIRSGVDPYPWEVELAYTQREFGIRESRRLAHERYFKLNPDQEYFETYDNNVEFEQADLN